MAAGQRLALAAVVAMYLAGETGVALAGPAPVLHLQPLSGGNPYDDGRCDADYEASVPPFDPFASLDHRDYAMEAEPDVAVNPLDPKNIVATWLTGVPPFANATIPGAAVSRDGGATWKDVPIPGLSQCRGGPYFQAQDGGLSTGTDGSFYLAAQALHATALSGQVTVTSSRDKGATWSQPAAVLTRESWPDKQRDPAVVDREDPDTLYMAWPHLRYPAPGSDAADLLFARSSDRGLTWSLPTPIYTPLPGQRPLDLIVEQLPDGSLLAVFTLVEAANYLSAPLFEHEILAIRSSDGGATWSPPARVAALGRWGGGAGNRDERGDVYNIPHSQLAVGEDGTAHVVWQDIASPDSTRILASSSRDGGRTWSPARDVVSAGALAMLPSIAVTSDGTIGVSWYDTRKDVPGDDELTAEFWFGHSHDGGARWHSQRVAGPFDLREPRARRADPTSATLFPMGEYTGLEAMPDGFAAAFAMAAPQAEHGYADIFFARIRTPSAR